MENLKRLTSFKPTSAWRQLVLAGERAAIIVVKALPPRDSSWIFERRFWEVALLVVQGFLGFLVSFFLKWCFFCFAGFL